MERQLDGFFDPPFAHVDNANRKELMHKQFMGFLKTPPKTGELRRGVDPTKETTEEKLRSTGDRAFFLGRRVLVFARQRADGSVAELSVRQSSGFHAFDDDAIAAVERALAARPPRAGELKNGEVRTLWQLDATGYVVIAPEPTLKFDESTGKSEWIYPLQKRVDKAVKLVAVY
jgi:TonB family protein